MADESSVNREWLAHIEESLSGLKFGVVQITVHNGQLVQIERTERVRFDPPRGETGTADSQRPGRQK